MTDERGGEKRTGAAAAPAPVTPTPEERTEGVSKQLADLLRARIDRYKSKSDEKKELEQGGLTGWFIGDVAHAPTRIAFWAIIISFVLIILCMNSSANPSLVDKIATSAFAVMSAALGFVFGQRVGPK